jgi:DNA recombination protein RmuC
VALSIEFWIFAVLLLLNLLLLVWLLLRKPADTGRAELLATLTAGNEKVEREVRREVTENARSSRQELASTFATFQQTLTQQSAEAIRTQNTQIDAFGQQLALLQKTLADTLTMQLQSVSESNSRRMAEVRDTLEKQLAQLQQTNSAKLDEMRKTVDEKLQSTLETRLGESFKQVADRI